MSCAKTPRIARKGITYIRVADSSVALGQLASAWHDHPSSKLKLVGVTGTNGKTTTATLLYEMARLEGYKAGLLSTVCNYIEGARRAYHAHHARPADAQRAAGRDGRGRMRLRVTGGQLTRRRTAPHSRTHVRRRRVLQPHARPPRLPPHGGQLHARQEEVLRHAPSRSLRPHQRRRQVGPVTWCRTPRQGC